MTNSTELKQVEGIQHYYQQAEAAYKNWGKDLNREGIYALHCGYEEPGERISHWESIKRLTQQVIMFMEIDGSDIILDAGCGSGAAAFEITSQYPSSTVCGINLVLSQLMVGQIFAREINSTKIYFSLQDYIQTGIESDVFDKILFFESIAHAQKKLGAFQESARLLRLGGSLTVADIFLQREPHDEEEKSWIYELERGWYMPDLNSIEDLRSQLKETGFVLNKESNISKNILPSTLRMRLNSEKRLKDAEQQVVSDEILWSRKAVVASHKVVESGLIGYFLINATKH